MGMGQLLAEKDCNHCHIRHELSGVSSARSARAFCRRKLMMKTFFQISLAVLGVTTGAWAGPLLREQVSAQAKWVIHFDAERFREGKLGAFYTNDLMPQHLADAEAKTGFDFGPLFRALKSATAYGPDFGAESQQSGVVLLQSDADAVRGLKEHLAAHTKRVKGEAFPIYWLDKDTLAATLHEGRVLLGKSPEHLRAAAEVLEGKRPNLTNGAAFKDLAEATNHFILVAGAEGLSGNVPLPAVAKMFRKADGLRLRLDEQGGKLLLNISLQAESAAVAGQMKLVLDGVLAWGSIEKSDDENTRVLLDSARVSTDGRRVSLSAEYPVERVKKAMLQP